MAVCALAPLEAIGKAKLYLPKLCVDRGIYGAAIGFENNGSFFPGAVGENVDLASREKAECLAKRHDMVGMNNHAHDLIAAYAIEGDLD